MGPSAVGLHDVSIRLGRWVVPPAEVFLLTPRAARDKPYVVRPYNVVGGPQRTISFAEDQ